MQKSKSRMDKSYIAPQLTAREKVIAGTFTLLATGFFLFAIGIPILILNLFSPTYPWRGKVVNIAVLLAGLGLVGAIAALLLW
jgi:uncharacterized membrane protein YqjE